MLTAARNYALRVTEELGLRGESSCIDREKPLRVYIAVDGRLPGYPSHDVALLWTECHGWSVAVEESGALDVTVMAHMGGAVDPPPRTVARWVRRLLVGGEPQRESRLALQAVPRAG